MSERKPGYLVILAAALAILTLGSSRLSGGAPGLDTIVLDLLGVALFLWLAQLPATLSEPPAENPPLASRLRRWLCEAVEAHPGRIGLLLLSGIAQLYSVSIGLRPDGNSQPWPAFGCWALSVLLFLAACLPPRPIAAVKSWSLALLKTRGLDLALLLLLTAGSFVLRAASRETIPYPLSGDEASVGMNGLAIFDGRTTSLFTTGWSGQPNLSFLLPGLLQWALGADISALRLFPALVGTLAVPAIYLLALEVWDRRMALVSATFLATYHYHIHFSRIAVNNVVDPTLTVASFYFLWRGLRTEKTLDYALAGVFCGLSIYSYAGGRLLFALVAALLGYLALRQRHFVGKHLPHLASLAGAALATSFPMWVFFASHRDEFMTRINQVGILQTGWLTREMAMPGKSLYTILLDRFSLSFFPFIHMPPRLGFYNSPEPLVGLGAGALFVLGLGWCLWHWRHAGHFMILLWFLPVVAGAALTVDLPNAARMVAAIPAVALLVALGLVRIVDLVQRFSSIPPKGAQLATAAALLLLCIASLQFYFFRYTPGNYFADANSEMGMEVGYYLRSLGPDYRAYFLGRPRIFFNFPSIEYLRREVTGADGPEKLPPDFAFPATDKKMVFVFIPERSGELRQLHARFPEGQVVTFYRKTRNEPLFLTLELPPSTAGSGPPLR